MSGLLFATLLMAAITVLMGVGMLFNIHRLSYTESALEESRKLCHRYQMAVAALARNNEELWSRHDKMRALLDGTPCANAPTEMP